MNFTGFAVALNAQFQSMAKGQLYVVEADKDEMWNLYLDAYPEGTNEIYKERREHDCNTCRHFIKNVGNVVTIENNKMVTIWDCELQDEYKVVADVMSNYIKSKKIEDVFLHSEPRVGALKTTQLTESGSITWHHLYAEIPSNYRSNDIPSQRAIVRTNKELLERGCKEFTQEALETVLELISQDGLYRGQEHKPQVDNFLKLLVAYSKAPDKDMWLWQNSHNPAVRFKNTVIGTLVQDISEGMELDRAVSSFETKVAPQNYKRTTAVITQGMVNKAMETIDSLGIEHSLHRRFAKLEDISVNNVLFADRSSQVVMKDTVADLLITEVKNSTKKFDKVDEVHIDDFITNVLPTAQSIEMYFECKHQANLCSLIAPVYADAPNILKWSNNFSWAYRGGLTDSIKEHVKKAGGRVDGFFRISLSWTNDDDLDLHCLTPERKTIYYGDKHPNGTKGQLDVDMISGGTPQKPCVENIYWINQRDMPVGDYKIKMNQYTRRSTDNIGFTIEVEFNGELHHFTSSTNSTVDVVTIEYDGKSIKFKNVGRGITSGSVSTDIWGIQTNQFHKVNVLTLSPNFWDDNKEGNKHYMFMLDKCNCDESTIGIYNEFLRNELQPHRKVFEVLGSKMKVPLTESLSGLGFSSTKRDSVILKVTGAFTRTLKVLF